MISIDQAVAQRGKALHGADGEELGTIDAVYVDDAAVQATFAAVRTGRIGFSTRFVPLDEAELQGETLVVPYDKEFVQQAPAFDPDGNLSPDEEERLYAHYGLEIVEDAAATATADAAEAGGQPVGEGTMTRSEERLQVGTQQVEAGRVRLRKHVVTEMETVQVPVTKERLVIEREPIADSDATTGGGEPISDEEQEIVLTEERVVVAKEAVPVERIRVSKQAVTEDVTVSEPVRKEQIETDTDERPR
jgi:uncharacterized protein (TIGR02271 family)